MSRRPPIPEPVCDRAEDIAQEYDYSSLGEAIRHAFREAGYDV